MQPTSNEYLLSNSKEQNLEGNSTRWRRGDDNSNNGGKINSESWSSALPTAMRVLSWNIRGMGND